VKLKLKNATAYDGRVLRSMVLRGLESHGIDAVSGHFKVDVRYKRRGTNRCGRARLGETLDNGVKLYGSWMEILIDRPQAESAAPPARTMVEDIVGDGAAKALALHISATIDHELYHTRGLHHRAFPAHARWCHNNGAPWHDHAWRLEAKVEAVRVKPSKDALAEKKLAHCKAMLKAANTRLKRATTLQKKWSRKLRDLERKLALAPPEASEAVALAAGRSA